MFHRRAGTTIFSREAQLRLGGLRAWGVARTPDVETAGPSTDSNVRSRKETQMMNGDETRKLEMLARVRDFGAGHPAAFPPGGLAADLLTRVGAALDALADHAAAQIAGFSSARRATVDRTRARRALRDDLEAISRTAEAVDVTTPGVAKKFRMPGAARDQTLLGTARAFIADAPPFAAEFVRRELPADFLDTLASDVAAFEHALSAQRRSREGHKTATASIDEALAAGLAALRELDPVLRNKFRGDALMLLAWEQTSRVQRGPAARKAAPDDPAAAPPADVLA
jgi:hypothetical protein